MRNRIQQWKAEGGRTRDLWERVEDAEQREGVIFIVDENDPNKLIPEKPERTRAEREAGRLNGLLENVLKLREELKAGLDMIEWRAELLRLASERAAGVGNCGWDQRLCYGEKEFEEDGEAVLSSYEQDATPNDMDVDGYGQWWCSGEQKCGRHYEYISFLLFSRLFQIDRAILQVAEDSEKRYRAGTRCEGRCIGKPHAEGKRDSETN